ncbi:MAG: hypothetical protein EOO46_04080 [Flavobacterium sp.]|nr:MAG: hypothetical protein EOO46_04080 [Flavobacterium sp.]
MSGKLKLPKKSIVGLKVFCTTCKTKNPKCKHYDKHRYRMHVHIPNTKRGERSKVLKSQIYTEALDEALLFSKEVISNNYETVKPITEGNNYSLADAIMKYYQYMGGVHKHAHKRKNVSTDYQKECYRFCKFFADVVKKQKDITKMLASDTSQDDVSAFYVWATGHYAGKTFNKAMAALKAFYDFLINVEKVEMENPFEVYVTQKVDKKNPRALTFEEFNKILQAVDTADPIQHLNGRGENKNMYRPYLKEAFKLFLLTGGRREEVVTLKWNQILLTMSGVKFFQFSNLKVLRQKKSKNIKSETSDKYVPINHDLIALLNELGYEKFKGTDNYVIFPERDVTYKTMMDHVSKAFTHYRIAAGIETEISLSDLRKTYLTWVNAVLNKDTKILSSHSSNAVLENNYLDRTVLSAIEKGALEIKIFGT